QGAELPSDIGVDGIRLVGDGIKGHGWMMVEGIASNVPGAVSGIGAI
ncbi:MAG TPA: NAD(P)/FAD-dependent oxidoreductase, partial [Candidatus Poseidoniales archaeon]